MAEQKIIYLFFHLNRFIAFPQVFRFPRFSHNLRGFYYENILNQ